MLSADSQADLGANILVLEDEPVMREVLEELLSDEGYTVHTASRGEEAVERTLSVSIDLIIFDIRMEGIDGLETLARIQAGGLEVPSLAITGFAGDDDPVRALKLGVGDYIRKPFRTEQLLSSVAHLLEKHRAQERLKQSLEEHRQLTRWATQHLPKPALSSSLLAFGKLVSDLAQASGMLSLGATGLELSTLVLATDSGAGQAGDCPPSVSSWASMIDERYDGTGPLGRRGHDIPLEARLVGLARAATGHSAEALRKNSPGRYDPFLLEALERVQGDQNVAPARRVGLARALLAGGDRSQANRILQQVLSQRAGTPDGVEAALTLAHLAGSNQEATKGFVQQAIEEARAVGPQSLARTVYRGALLLTRLKLSEGPDMLRSAAPRLLALGLKAEGTLAQMLTEDVGPEQLEMVMRPEYEPELAAVVDLLLPRLLASAPEKALRRLTLRYPEVARGCQGILHDSLRPTAPEKEQKNEILRIVSFGPVQVAWAGRSLQESDWKGAQGKSLFAFLAAQERPVQEDHLLEQFWPEAQETSRRRLGTALSTLRRALYSIMGDSVDPISRQRDRFSLNPELVVWHDLQEFRKAQAANDWKRMASLYTAPYHEGCYMDWALRLREEVEEAVINALLNLAQAELETAPDQSLEYARRAQAMDSLQQRCHLQIMQAFLKLGQPENAVRQFQRCAQLLKRELGVEPSIEMFEVYQRARLAIP